MTAFHLISALFVLAGMVFSADGREAAWQHRPSPYRAEFSLYRKELPADTGLILTIPDCGTSENHGADVFCFDQSGRQLLRKTIGRGLGNTMLLLVLPDSGTRRIFAYWGSGMAAPQARIPVYCGLLAEILEFSPDSQALTWETLQPVLKEAPSLGFFYLRKPLVMENPADSRDSFIIRIRGTIPADRNWKQTWFVAADDSGYFLIDGKLQIERPGKNYVYNSLRGEYKKEISLSPGLHQAELICVNFSGQGIIAMGKLPGTPVPAFVTGQDFVHGGEARLTGISEQHGGPVPIFSYVHRSYMSIGEHFFTETEYTPAAENTEFTWHFDDGLKTAGQPLTRIHYSTDSLGLKIRCGHRRGAGQIDFPRRAPDRKCSPRDLAQYNRYAELLLNQWNQGMQKNGAAGPLIEFFLYHDFRREAIPVLEYALTEHSLTRKQERRILLALGRCASVHDPRKAQEAYQRLLPLRSNSEKRSEIVYEALEFAVFGLRDARLADYWIRQYGLAFHDRPARLHYLKAALAFLQKNEKDFVKFRQKIQDIRWENKDEILHASVRSNAAGEEIRKLLDGDFLLKARERLLDWQDLDPSSLLDGRHALLRAQLFRKLGWLDGALDLLNAAVLGDPLLPNLPDMEMMKADILMDLGKKDLAQVLYRKISTEYPNHPLAKKAAAKAK